MITAECLRGGFEKRTKGITEAMPLRELLKLCQQHCKKNDSQGK